MKRSIAQNHKDREQSRRAPYKSHSNNHTSLIQSFIKIVCAVILVTFLFGGFYTSAHNNRTEDPVYFTYYKSITIEYGDSLWTIAEKYMTDDYASVNEYITFLKEINHLHGDRIQEGQSLIISYNDTTFLE